MASIRLLKKDINFLTSELITQSFITQALFDKAEEKLIEEVQKALDFRNSLYDKIKIGSKMKDSKEIKKHFSKLRKKMIEDFEKLYLSNSDE